jgi:DNA mismatch repair protein MutS
LSTLTPMIEQYRTIRQKYPDCLLFFRLGDFYELFGEDAELASRELQIVLTKREIGKNQKTPMCGVPYHAAESYLKRLLDKGYKIAICEQLEDPKPGKGIVKRDVVRVLTPGTLLNPNFLDQSNNNFIIALNTSKEIFGCAWSDISTGKFFVSQFRGSQARGYLTDLITRLQPVECLIREEQLPSFEPFLGVFWQEQGVHLTLHSGNLTRAEALASVRHQFGEEQLVALDCGKMEEGLVAVSGLLNYIEDTQKTVDLPFRTLVVYTPHSSMYLDAMTRRNLEVFTTMREGKKGRSLIWALDHTITAIGARLLHQWLEFPLLNCEKIETRQNCTEALVNDFMLRGEVIEDLKSVYDLERIISRVDWQIANARDLLALARSLEAIPALKTMLEASDCKALSDLGAELDPVAEIRELICRAIKDETPIQIKDGDIIRDGYYPEVDHLRQVLDEGENWIKVFEASERERTGIKTLKVSYNKVYGYYIEVTRAHLDLVPPDYQRKQTLVQAERFVTPALSERESLFAGASEELADLEYRLFLEIRRQVGNAADRIRKDAALLARLDCLTSFAETASRYHYVRPKVNNLGMIRIKNGRHPVLEQILPEGSFIANDLLIGAPDNRIHLITGPNMAGKSTYMRQMALLVLLAHIGSFIPVEEAEIGLVDRIFVRAGAMDDLGRGQSTFMMEMSEVSYIIKHATGESLVVLDEIGRGTSTFDGLGIAWAIVEYLHNVIGVKALFATHYHQLNSLADSLTGVANYSAAVEEKDGVITFLRRVVPGGTDRSYGIQVAKLANLPEPLVARAGEIASELEAAGQSSSPETDAPDKSQLMLFDEENNIKQEIMTLDLLNTTPMEVMNRISDWQQKIRQEPEKFPDQRAGKKYVT